MSLVMTRQTGRKNQINPSKMELTMKWAWKTTRRRVMCVQQNCVNWYVYDPGVKVMTKNTKPELEIEKKEIPMRYRTAEMKR